MKKNIVGPNFFDFIMKFDFFRSRWAGDFLVFLFFNMFEIEVVEYVGISFFFEISIIKIKIDLIYLI